MTRRSKTEQQVTVTIPYQNAHAKAASMGFTITDERIEEMIEQEMPALEASFSGVVDSWMTSKIGWYAQPKP